jgi:hypothetical protein
MLDLILAILILTSALLAVRHWQTILGTAATILVILFSIIMVIT